MAPRKTAPPKIDPFAETKNDEAQTELPSNKENDLTDQNTETTNEISVTLKGGAGFDAPWVVVRGSDPGELVELLATDDLRELLDKAADRGAYFASKGGSGGGGGSRPPARSGGGGGRPSGGAKSHPQGKTSTCEHGDKLYKSGFSQKNNSQWEAFDCPQDVCKREWL